MFGSRFQQGFESAFSALLSKYNRYTSFFVNHKLISIGTVVAAIAIMAFLMAKTPSALIPTEDTGMIFVVVDMPAGTSQERTNEVMDKVDFAMKDIEGI